MFLILSILIATILTRSFFLDPDLGWHLYLGKEIVEKKSLVTTFIGYNHFAMLERPDHEWLSNIVLYEIDKYFGFIGLFVLFAGLLIITVWLLYKIIQKYLPNKAAVIFLLIFILLPQATNFGIRVQYILVFALVVLLYIKLFIKNPKERAYLYFFFSIILNNLHGGYITLLPAILLLELDLFDGKKIKENLINYAIVACSLIIPVIINPYGFDYFKLLINYGGSYYRDHIQEWTSIASFPWMSKILTIYIPLSVLLFAFTIDKYQRKIRYFEAIMLVIYGYLGVRYIRQFPIFAILAAPIVARAITSFDKSVKPGLVFKKLALTFSVMIVLALSAEVFYSFRPSYDKSLGLPVLGYPVKAADFIAKNHPKKGLFFNNYDWGGFLVWSHPELKIFIDGRGPEKLINGKTSILEEYNNFYSQDRIYTRSKLEQYQISYVLLKKPEKNSPLDLYVLNLFDQKIGTNALLEYLIASPDWKKVYEDDISEVYFKNNNEEKK
ncbi:MAG: hypothetical protein WC451_03990 [Patescibacteria group bacterium]